MEKDTIPNSPNHNHSTRYNSSIRKSFRCEVLLTNVQWETPKWRFIIGCELWESHSGTTMAHRIRGSILNVSSTRTHSSAFQLYKHGNNFCCAKPTLILISSTFSCDAKQTRSFRVSRTKTLSSQISNSRPTLSTASIFEVNF